MRYRTAAVLSVVLIGGMFGLDFVVKHLLLPSLEQGGVIPFYDRVLLGVAVFFLSWRVILALPIVVVLFTIAVFTNESVTKDRPATATPVKRPIGVVVIAGLNILGGVVVIAVGMFRSQPPQGVELGLLATVALFGVGLGVALQKLENWARVLTIVFSGLSLIAIPGAFMAHSLPDAMATLARGLLSLWIVWYLLQPQIKAAFGRHS
ncbi:MAG: hypothetical protein WBF26_11225 [Candidatus Sulfotelmatobacter sp.]